ncbi:PilN domain-containing protein [Nitrospina gracilis]|uniref:PilN domain-containing protein n=1 Tax=Nitrospina gracilis TaxID=35801 RepID=UPI001F3A516F|nr:PilN domain-containing protein [Nitrospina gracilis]MCF8721865.1 type IV pilus assembly protein PilN [Nitrospina gracilis Nb-211]
MNLIRVNLYDYQRIVREIIIQKLFAGILSAGLLAGVACFMVWAWQLVTVAQLEGDIEEVQAQVNTLTPDYRKVQKLKKKKERYGDIIKGIDGLRTKRSRTTELLEDLGRSLPDGVWLTVVEQRTLDDLANVPDLFLGVNKDGLREERARAEKEGREFEPHQFIQITGQGDDHQAIVHFVDRLRTLPYFDHVMLAKTEQKWEKNHPVKEFTIYSHVLKLEAPQKG